MPLFVDHNSSSPSLYYFDRSTGKTNLIDHRPGAGNEGSAGWLQQARITADGSAVFFESHADDLVPGQVAQPGTEKIYRWNLATGANEVLLPVPGDPARPCDGDVHLADISFDGRYVLLWGTCQLVAGDTNSTNDLYLYDRATAVAILISHQPGNPAASLGVTAQAFALAAGARRIAYTADTVPYSYDRASRRATPLLQAYYDPAEPVHGAIRGMSADGSRIVLENHESNVVPFDASPSPETYLAILDDGFADGFEGGSTAAWSQTVP